MPHPAAWSVETVRGLTLLRCATLLAVPGVAHAFSTRRADDGADFDLGRADETDPRIARRRERFARATGLEADSPAILLQVHGRRIVDAGELAGGAVPEADGVLALRDGPPGPAPAVRVADCVPVLLASRDGRALAAVHAGWRGTAAGIAGHAVELLAASGVDPVDLVAALGPAIGGCCYEVGAEVVRAVAAACAVPPGELAAAGPGGGVRLDLRHANRLQLERAGLPPEAVSAAPWCTACDNDRFFSYRREGTGAGRLIACLGWSEGDPEKGSP